MPVLEYRRLAPARRQESRWYASGIVVVVVIVLLPIILIWIARLLVS